MLFNTPVFLFGFLPVTFSGVFLMARRSHSAVALWLGIALPIGISFYTFTQIAFLIDCWQGKVTERRLVHSMLFISDFPRRCR